MLNSAIVVCLSYDAHSAHYHLSSPEIWIGGSTTNKCISCNFPYCHFRVIGVPKRLIKGLLWANSKWLVPCRLWSYREKAEGNHSRQYPPINIRQLHQTVATEPPTVYWSNAAIITMPMGGGAGGADTNGSFRYILPWSLFPRWSTAIKRNDRTSDAHQQTIPAFHSDLTYI